MKPKEGYHIVFQNACPESVDVIILYNGEELHEIQVPRAKNARGGTERVPDMFKRASSRGRVWIHDNKEAARAEAEFNARELEKKE